MYTTIIFTCKLPTTTQIQSQYNYIHLVCQDPTLLIHFGQTCSLRKLIIVRTTKLILDFTQVALYRGRFLKEMLTVLSKLIKLHLSIQSYYCTFINRFFYPTLYLTQIRSIGWSVGRSTQFGLLQHFFVSMFNVLNTVKLRKPLTPATFMQCCCVAQEKA